MHGFVDYFFHTQFADALGGHGYDVYALDLRDYGRSIRDGRPPNHITDLGTYAEEIDAAIRVIRAEHDEVVLLGHSLGGMVTSLWADARRGEGLIDALVLNSPWLDLRGSWFERTVFTAALRGVGRIAPRLVVGKVGPFYGRALHEGTGGEWSYDLAWKPLDGFPATAGFGRAVRRGHARVARGLAVDVPVLLLASDASGPDDVWHDALVTTDSVLDVADMKRLAPKLGPGRHVRRDPRRRARPGTVPRPRARHVRRGGPRVPGRPAAVTTTAERSRLRALRIAARYRRTPLGRLVQRTVDGFVDIEPFDRAMTLAAQAFVSIVPVMIVMAALRPTERGFGSFLADSMGLSDATRDAVAGSVPAGATVGGSVGVLGLLVALLSATSYSRALERMYAKVWHVPRPGLRAAWRWLATVLAVILAVGLLGMTREATEGLPPPALWDFVVRLVVWTVVWTYVPWALLRAEVPFRALAFTGARHRRCSCAS